MSFEGLRVLLVGPLPPGGGMATQTRQLSELLRAGGATVQVVATNAPYRPALAGRVPVLRAFVRLVPYLFALWRTTRRADLLHVMANSGWSWHLFAAPAIWCAHLRGVPVLVNYRGGEAASFLERSASGVRRSMRRVAVLAVPSGFLESVFARHGMQAEVLPNIVDLARFHPAGLPDAARRRSAPHLVVARNLEKLYDNETALRAFARLHAALPEARLTLAGSGPDESHLRALADSLGLAHCVRFPGRLDRDAMAALYREADLTLNPSLADNMPNALLESMASGVPVVSTNVGGIPWMVRDGETALLVAPGDAVGMAEAAGLLLRHPARWQALSDAGLREVRRYTWAHVGPGLAALYRQAMARPGNTVVA